MQTKEYKMSILEQGQVAPVTLDEAVTIAHLDPTLTQEQRHTIEIAGLSLDAKETSVYSDGEAHDSRVKAAVIAETIKSLQVAHDRYIESAESLEDLSPDAANDAAELHTMFGKANLLYEELETLRSEEAGLKSIVELLSETVSSYKLALEPVIHSMVNGNMYSNEQPPEALVDAAVEIAKRDNSNLFVQTAAQNFEDANQRLQQATYNLQQLRFRIELKKQEFDELVRQAQDFASITKNKSALVISEVNSLRAQGLKALGGGIINLMDNDGSNLLGDGLTAAELESEKNNKALALRGN
jgi:hypothetical protein